MDKLIGKEVFFGHYVDKDLKLKDVVWIVAEKLNDDAYVLQSEGVSAGNSPNGIADDYKNISSLTPCLGSLYASIDWAEYHRAVGDGLYLVPYDKKDASFGYTINQASGDTTGSKNYYQYALYKAACNNASFGATSPFAWTGSRDLSNSGISYSIDTSGTLVLPSYSNAMGVLAPAFNLDASKIDLVTEGSATRIVPHGLELGGEYTMGGHKFICAKKLADGIYAMQSEGMVKDSWENAVSSEIRYNKAYVNIADNNSTLKAWYNTWKEVEASGGRVDDVAGSDRYDGYNYMFKITPDAGNYSSSLQSDGLYLINISEVTGVTDTSSNPASSVINRYGAALMYASATEGGFVWTGSRASGTPYGGRIWTIYNKYDNKAVAVSTSYDTDYRCNYIVAPAFNLNATGINVTNGVITKKVS